MEPKPVDQPIAWQLLRAGMVMGALMRKEHGLEVDKGAIEAVLDEIDIEVLEKYVSEPREGFKYMAECKMVLDMAKKRRSSN